MKRAKIKAGMCIAACPLYMLSAELLLRLDLPWCAVLSMVMAMLCTAESFLCGREYEWERRMAADQDEADFMCFETGMKQLVCKNCGCPEFTMKAGHMICLCCGSAASREDLEAKDGKKTR